jgi:TubC N-terminal docking domain
VDSAELQLSELRALDIRLFPDGDRLRCSAPKGRLNKELKLRIATQKPDLARTLRYSTSQPAIILQRSAPCVTSPKFYPTVPERLVVLRVVEEVFSTVAY